MTIDYLCLRNKRMYDNELFPSIYMYTYIQDVVYV